LKFYYPLLLAATHPFFKPEPTTPKLTPLGLRWSAYTKTPILRLIHWFLHHGMGGDLAPS